MSAPYLRLKNSKRTYKCQFTVLENPKTKKWTEWRAKRGTLPKLSTFLSQLKRGGGFGEKTTFRKKVSMPKNWKGDPLGFLKTQSVVKYQKMNGGKIFVFGKNLTVPKKSEKMNGGKIFVFGKNLTVPKKSERGHPLGFSNIHSDAKQQKIEGGPFGEKKSRSAEKNWKGDPLVSPGMVCYAEKQEKTFLVQFARPNGAIWCNFIL